MSLIDYLNHHSFAPPHQRSSDKRELIATPTEHAQPSGECFVQYGPYDAQDLLVRHGFVDQSAHFVRSASFEVEVEDFGVFRVGSEIGVQTPKTLTDRAFDIAWSFPATRITDMGDLATTSIFIAGQSDQIALKRALTMAMLSWDRTIPKDIVSKRVDQLAIDVVDATLRYYSTLKRMVTGLAGSSAARSIAQMIETQERILSTQRLG